MIRYHCTDCGDMDARVNSDTRCTNCGSGRLMTVGIDLSNGIETHVEAIYKDGVLHVTDMYEIVDGTCSTKEQSE